nr:hypothetical protein [Bacteroidota bacterium]
MDLLCASTKKRKAVDVPLGEFAKRKYGFSYDDRLASPEQFYEAIWIEPYMHTLKSLYHVLD